MWINTNIHFLHLSVLRQTLVSHLQPLIIHPVIHLVQHWNCAQALDYGLCAPSFQNKSSLLYWEGGCIGSICWAFGVLTELLCFSGLSEEDRGWTSSFQRWISVVQISPFKPFALLSLYSWGREISLMQFFLPYWRQK